MYLSLSQDIESSHKQSSGGELLGVDYIPCKFPRGQELMDGGVLGTSREGIG